MWLRKKKEHKKPKMKPLIGVVCGVGVVIVVVVGVGVVSVER
jgi:hypothetical protein